MARRRKSVLNEIGDDFRKLHQVNAEYGDIVRDFEYRRIRDEARFPPVRSRDALLAALYCPFFLLVQLPLYALKRAGLFRANAVMLVRDDLEGDFLADAQTFGNALRGLLGWATFWLGLALRCLGIELKIIAFHGFIWSLVAAGYVIVGFVLFWLAFYVLFYWP